MKHLKPPSPGMIRCIVCGCEVSPEVAELLHNGEPIVNLKGYGLCSTVCGNVGFRRAMEEDVPRKLTLWDHLRDDINSV